LLQPLHDLVNLPQTQFVGGAIHDQHGFGLENNPHLFQVVGCECAARVDEIDDQIRQADGGRQLDRPP
jgi:hypothetical protein